MDQSLDKVLLAGVDHYRVTEPMSEGMRVILTYRGEPYSPAYIQGISGAAFRMAGICPCAPTCSNIIEPAALARLFGYDAEWWPFQGGVEPVEKDPLEILARVKHEIRGGRPVLLWHAFTTAEWDVVCGFDEGQGIFYGRGSYLGLHENDYASADNDRALNCLDICPALGAVFVGEKTGGFNPLDAELDALREAVRHAHVTHAEAGEDQKWVMLEGIQCYRRWAREFRQDPERGRTSGDSYCLAVYRSTRRAAASFMREMAFKYEDIGVEFRRGQHAFEREAEFLDRSAAFLGWDTPEGVDAVRNQRVADLLEQAGEAYADGIEAIEMASRKL